ncbi:hypothetical protein L841_3923 [Mycobacterium sp. MAC_080597_8934]|nr:hypothetical protein L842_0810 [Mycobacterium intracellulare MIN_052511_1280]ETZ65409.1 hypothetical protein L841_3923 [Mycobacterium sp. MAC_080597_8934]ETZ72400.1 hypothetical protein L840_1383 [Mycobacterium sp. MAC_011194_8550]
MIPMMSATENLYAAALLVDQRTTTRNLYASSIMQLCRSAMETSARTIWLLSDPDRNVRRDQRDADSLVPERMEPTIARWMSLYA